LPLSLAAFLIGPIQPLDSSLFASVYFLVAALLLDAFDISLPRGDSVGGAGALCSAALIVLGPIPAILIAVVSAVVVHLLLRGVRAPLRLAAVIVSRSTALVVGTAVFRVMSQVRPLTMAFVAVPAVFLVTELVVAQAVSALWTGRALLRLIQGNANSQGALAAAQWSASVLLLLTYSGMRAWSLVPAVALLLLMRQSYALFLSIRETYRTTVEVLVEAAESQDTRRVGHSDRTAVLARSIAMGCGLAPSEVERIGYAALLHDLGKLAEQPGVIDEDVPVRSSSADVVRGVEFFEQIEPILRVCDGVDQSPSDDNDLLAGLIVALASDIDAEYHPEVAAAHDDSAVGRVAPRVTPTVKARAVGAALRLGYRIPAVG